MFSRYTFAVAILIQGVKDPELEADRRSAFIGGPRVA
jgi:hypothetical protein